MYEYDAIVVFAFGKPETIMANKEISAIAKEQADKFHLPILIQNDIPQMMSFPVYFPKKNHLSTLEVAMAFKKTIDKFNWKKILVIAAAPHIERCARDLRRLGIKAIPIDEITYIDWPVQDIWFDRRSNQWWTKSKSLWWMREIPLRLIPWWLYKKISS